MSNTPNYFGILPAPVRYCETLEPNAKLLFCEITALSNKYGYCFATNSHFAQLFKVHEMTVSKWVSSLCAAGFVRIEISKEAGNQRRIYPLCDVLERGGVSKKTYRGGKQKDLEGISKNAYSYKQKDLPPISENAYRNNKDNNKFNSKIEVVEKTTPPTPPKNKKIEFEIESAGQDVNYTVSSTATPTATPPSSARPPAPAALPWQASADYQAGPVSFGQALKGRGTLPENTDTDYYYNRGAEWSANSAARTGNTPLAADWVGKIHGWAVADMNAGKLHTIQQQTYTLHDGTKYTISGNSAHQGNPAGPSQQPRRARGEINTEAAIAGGQRVLERLRSHGLYLPKNDG